MTCPTRIAFSYFLKLSLSANHIGFVYLLKSDCDWMFSCTVFVVDIVTGRSLRITVKINFSLKMVCVFL